MYIQNNSQKNGECPKFGPIVHKKFAYVKNWKKKNYTEKLRINLSTLEIE